MTPIGHLLHFPFLRTEEVELLVEVTQSVTGDILQKQ